MNIFIGGAWPYANGSLHLGHISSLLPGDILARYFRQHGDNVLYVSGSDCNGTPISIRAKQEGITPTEVADRYHGEFAYCFKQLGFSYDCYTRTDTPNHHQIVQEIFLELLENDYIYKKNVEQTYCEPCEQFLPDRYVEGNCPHCGNPARGDQCDYCSAILDPIDLVNKSCRLCGNRPTLKTTEHFYLALTKLQTKLEDYTEDAKNKKSWRTNAIHLTKRYLKEGLQDRAVSRDLPIGVSVPVKGYKDKKIYVWIEAVSGYYSASKQWGINTNQSFEPFWNEETKTYYVHGKDNIPFHTIIWPAILMGIGNPTLPEHIVSNEYLTLEKKKLSTSRNWAVWVPDIVDKYHPDSIRYFLTINAPENRDTDFSWREFINSHNGELLGAYGNFINRSLKFIEKNYEGKVPEGSINQNIKTRIDALYNAVGSAIENARFKEAIEEIFVFIRSANKYFDEKQPWRQWKDNKTECSDTLLTCVYIIANLAQLLAPFLPFSSNEVKNILNIHHLLWQPIQTKEIKLSPSKPIFERIDVSSIDLELKRLLQQAK